MKTKLIILAAFALLSLTAHADQTFTWTTDDPNAPGLWSGSFTVADGDGYFGGKYMYNTRLLNWSFTTHETPWYEQTYSQRHIWQGGGYITDGDLSSFGISMFMNSAVNAKLFIGMDSVTYVLKGMAGDTPLDVSWTVAGYWQAEGVNLLALDVPASNVPDGAMTGLLVGLAVLGLAATTRRIA